MLLRFPVLALPLAMLTILTLLLAQPALAGSSEDARKQLEVAITHVLDLVKNPGYGDEATRNNLQKQIETEVHHIFDFEEFSSRTVGAPWRQFNAEQKKDFSAAFAELMIFTYLDKVNGYNGERIQYVGEVASPAGDRVEVRTILTLKDGKAVPVAYRMLPKSNGWKVYDVLIENISLVKNYRTQFQDILSKGSPVELISRVRQKAQEVREKSNATHK